jgi:predicted neuraminidase
VAGRVVRRDVFPPGTWRSAHAASVVIEANGSLLASWFAGSREGARDAAIHLSRFDGAAWSPPWPAVDTPGRADGNSVLWRDGAGGLRIWYVTMEGRGWASCPVRERRSTDCGQTWSEASYIQREPGWMVRNEPVAWRDRILMPMYDERDWSALVLLSDDGGETWRPSEPVRAQTGIIQPALAPLPGGGLLMLLRSRGAAVYRSHSDDGVRWSAPEPTALPNPNSAVELVALAGGGLLAVYNAGARARTPLRVARSPDGERWDVWRDLEVGPGEFSYPTAVQGADGTVHVLYTWRRRTIAHAAFDEAWAAGEDG